MGFINVRKTPTDTLTDTPTEYKQEYKELKNNNYIHTYIDNDDDKPINTDKPLKLSYMQKGVELMEQTYFEWFSYEWSKICCKLNPSKENKKRFEEIEIKVKGKRKCSSR